MRCIVLTEEQVRNILSEATDGMFSTDELDAIRSFAGRVRYCKEHLGEPIGNGSSRMVFQIDDERCLKLAKNAKGVAQNRVESEWWKQSSDLFPKIFSFDSEDNMWIECEYVLPAKAADFKVCTGATFEEFQQFCYSTFALFSRTWHEGLPRWRYDELLENSEFFQELETYLTNTCEANGDITALRNWGLAKRYGEAYPVFLDHGLSEDVYTQYYQK